ncbi:MAG: serine/threonine-protein kinase, partial [Pirellulales bacterium]
MVESDDQLPAPAQEELYESLLIAYDEALARGEAVTIDERAVPPELAHRLRAALACVSLLARAPKPSTPPPPASCGVGVPPASGASVGVPPVSCGVGVPPALTSGVGVPPATPLKPAIGRFELLRELGRGGHGVVFLAVDPRLRRLVALKVPRPEVLVTPDLHRRFLREGQVASALAHPNLVPIYEVGEDGPLCYIAAGYCEGPSLANWLKQQSSPVPPHEAAALVARLADATAHAHARGIVH